MERVLGTPALFATAYGNVGSSIYYALGLTAVYALGLTPLVFVVAGIVFAATAATYAEGTARFPEAGGSASFSRHAFDELVSFVAGWAQMLVYVVTVAVSAFFVPHYLSIFWEPLNTNPWDIVVGVIVIVVLVTLNIVGVQEAAKLSISLAVVDFATQILLVIVGFALVFSPDVLVDNVHWGVAPTWSNLAIAIPVAMLAYTGVETVSNLAEEARDPARTVPNSYKLVAGAVFAIYFTLPLVALSALPVTMIDGELTTLLALPPEEGGYANDPILGVVENIGLEGILLDGAEIYVGILAATILVIATNAGVIGASRITYSMATYRQLPEVLRRLHPRFKTPWLALVLFAGIAPILVILPGDVNFVGTLYSLGATLSFTIAHVSIVRLRMQDAVDAEIPYRARPNVRIGASRLAAVRASRGPGHGHLVPRPRRPEPAHALGRPRLDGRRPRGLRGLSASVPARRAACDREGAARARGSSGARVPQPPRPRHRGAVVRGRHGHGVQARRGASRADRRAERRRGSARPGAHGSRSRARGGRQLEARPGGRDRRLLRRARAYAPRAGSRCRTGDRRRGRCSKRRDHRPRLATPEAHGAPGGGLRQDGRLRAQARELPRARHGGGRMKPYSVAVLVLAVLFVAIGVALLVRTAAAGGGVVGYVLGALFVVLGVARFSLERTRVR